jgi:triphosphoribosyl-dephospho-CoA synthase
MPHPEATRSPGLLAQLACLLEASARKPGNVHPGAAFAGLSHVDFLLSAAAIAAPLDRAAAEGVGPAILAAVRATRGVVATNTNLGMVLLLAPLAAVPAGEPDLAAGVARVLAGLTVADAAAAYEAIRLAAPGGLGRAAEQDVAAPPTVTLREAMRLAAGRDLVARQYATDYADVFGIALPALRDALRAGAPPESAIVAAFLATLAAHPDTLILRKRGPEVAAEASRRAAEALRRAGPTPDPDSAPLRDLDTWLRGDGHARNPGATADLVAAALFAALRDGTLALPRPGGPAGWSGPATAPTMEARREP